MSFPTKRLVRGVLLAAVAALALPGSALADQIVNGLDASPDAAFESLNLTLPDAGGTTIYVNPTGGDNKPGCNLQNHESVTFSVTSSNDGVATVSPSTLTFDGCGDTKAVTVTPVAAGSADIRFARAGGDNDGWETSTADFTVNVAPKPVVTPPNVAPTVGEISGLTAVNEGDTGTYAVTATDADNDALTYHWSVVSGNAEIQGSDSAESAAVHFTDGPSEVVLGVDVSDGHGHTVSRSLDVAEANVAPKITDWVLSGGDGVACIGGNRVNASFNVTDPADEAHDPITGTLFGLPILGRSISESHVFGPGVWQLTANVDDGDGGTDTRSAGVTFLYTASGILAPINTGKTSNFKLGSTLPVKVAVTDCNGVAVSDLALHVALTKVTNTTDGVVNEDVLVVSNPDAGSLMRYDAAAGQYIYNLSTKKSSFAPNGGALDLGHYKLTVSGVGIDTQTAYFDIVK